MKKFISFCCASLTALFLCPTKGSAVAGGELIYDNYLPIPPAVAYSSTFSIRADGIDWAAAQIVVTSVTQNNAPTFNDGQAATGSFTVNDYTSLSTAPAHSTLTISSDTALANSCISGGGPTLGSFNVCSPSNYTITGTTATDCASIAAAITAAFNSVASTCPAVPGNVINSTFTFGKSIENQFTWNASTPAAISTAAWVGGHDNAVACLNGTCVTANAVTNGFFPITSNVTTATNLATAFSASAASLTVNTSASGNVVGATATIVGAAGNYALTTSTQGALTIAPVGTLGAVNGAGVGGATGNLFGGAASQYVFNGSVITSTGSTLGLAQGVWFSQTVGSNGLAPLVSGTTYFAIPGPSGSNTLQLSLTSTGAVAGLPIVFTSSAVPTTSDVFKLNFPVGLAAGNSGVQWVASNDNTHWLPYTTTPFNITVASETYTSYVSTGVVNNFDFGHYNYSYIGLSVTASTAAPTNILAHIIGNAP